MLVAITVMSFDDLGIGRGYGCIPVAAFPISGNVACGKCWIGVLSSFKSLFLKEEEG